MTHYQALGRAVVSHELLQDALASNNRSVLDSCLALADRSRPATFREMSNTLKRLFDEVVTDMQTPLSNCMMEAINSLHQFA